jgi:hypothetical protein
MFDDNIAFALMADRAARWSADLPLSKKLAFILPVRARPAGWLSALSVSNSKSVVYGAFVWARRALNRETGGFRPGQYATFHESRVNWRPLMFAKFFQCAAAAEHRLRAHLLGTSSHLLSTSLAHL